MSFTADNSEVAEKFIKRLFSEHLIAQAEKTSEDSRNYMQYGTVSTEENKVYL